LNTEAEGRGLRGKTGGKGMKQGRRIWLPAVVTIVAVFSLVVGLPSGALALNSCNGVVQFSYLSGKNYPQPVPPGTDSDDLLTVQLTLGTGTIQGGTVLNLHQVNFDLDCLTGTNGGTTSCTDDGAVIQYGGDGTITTDCLVNGNPVQWVSGHGTTTSPNEVQLVPEQSGSPVTLSIPAGTTSFCNISFGIQVVGRTSNADGFIQQNAFYAVSMCNNGTNASGAGSGSFPECPVCNDNNACTTDTCNSDHTPASDAPNLACVFTAIPPCNDNNACTTDTCNPATGCTSTPISCNDNNACTTDTCNPATGCTSTPIPPCNDNNACTTDTCNPATGCTSTPIPPCNDNNACTTDTCNPATGCTSTPIPPCNDNNACTTDTCNPATGCTSTPISCNDNNACTADTCNPATGCTSTPIPPCNDNNACTTDTCNPATGCTFTAIPPCNDNNACTTDTCNPATGCVSTPVVCDNNNPCGAEACNPETGMCQVVGLPSGFTFLVRTHGQLGNGAQILGNVGANDSGGRIRLGKRVFVSDGNSVSADFLDLVSDSSVFDVLTNHLNLGPGAIVRGTTGPVTLPLTNPFCPIPPIDCTGGVPQTIQPFDNVTLAPGTYGDVLVRSAASLTLAPAGTFTFCSLTTSRNATISVAGGTASIINIANKFRLADSSTFLPIGTTPTPAVNIAGDMFRISRQAKIQAFISAPNAMASFGHGSTIIGSVCVLSSRSDKLVTMTCPPMATGSR